MACLRNVAISFESVCLSVQKERLEIDFHDDNRGGHLGFPIGTILVFFDLQYTAILPIKFRINWPYGQGVAV